MRLNAKGHYAILALLDVMINEGEQPVPLSDVAQRQNLPLPLLEQLFTQLRRAGIVASVRGKKGGYKLSWAAEQIKIGQVLAVIEGPVHVTRCNANGHISCQGDKARCLAHYLWEGLEEQIHNYLASISLADVYNKGIHLRACSDAHDFSSSSLKEREEIN